MTMMAKRGPGRRKETSGTIYDVAQACGVSIGTVSRTFNNKHDVADETRIKVLEAAKRVQYRPRLCARRLSIGLLVENFSEANEVGFVSNVVSTVAKYLTSHGGVLELVSLDDFDSIYRNHLRGLVAVVFGRGQERLRQIDHIPVVLINNNEVDAPNVHLVASDHAQGAYLAVKHFLERGHRRIGFLEILQNAWGSRERQAGYYRAFREAGVKFVPDYLRFCGGLSVAGEIEQLLSMDATSLLVCGEDLSLAANHVLLNDMHLRVPDELSVVSYEIPLVSSLLHPPQTTVSQPWEQLGRVAVETILSLIHRKGQPPVRKFLPNRLIERQSVISLL